jgi:hypothetical protein
LMATDEVLITALFHMYIYICVIGYSFVIMTKGRTSTPVSTMPAALGSLKL